MKLIQNSIRSQPGQKTQKKKDFPQLKTQKQRVIKIMMRHQKIRGVEKWRKWKKSKGQGNL